MLMSDPAGNSQCFMSDVHLALLTASLRVVLVSDPSFLFTVRTCSLDCVNLKIRKPSVESASLNAFKTPQSSKPTQTNTPTKTRTQPLSLKKRRNRDAIAAFEQHGVRWQLLVGRLSAVQSQGRDPRPHQKLVP